MKKTIKMALGPLRVLWKGLWRTRVRGKERFYNSVRWLKEEGWNHEEIKTILYSREIKKCNEQNIKGEKRANRIKRRKADVRDALKNLPNDY